jgi:hypothetical protein
MENFKPTVDAALNRLVTSEPRVPGVVAMAPIASATSTKEPPASGGSIGTRI